MTETLAIYKEEKRIFENISFADTFFNRLMGLLNEKKLDDNSGLILKPCKQIHTFQMKYGIDAIFLSKENEVLYIEHNLIPNKVSKYVKRANVVLEVASGMAKRHCLDIGDILSIKPY